MFLTFLIFHQCQDTIVSAVKKSIFQWFISNLRLIVLQRLDAIYLLSYLSVAVVDTKLIIHFGKSIPIITIFLDVCIMQVIENISMHFNVGIYIYFMIIGNWCYYIELCTKHHNILLAKTSDILVICANRCTYISISILSLCIEQNRGAVALNTYRVKIAF